jgi:hypothetical protein
MTPVKAKEYRPALRPSTSHWHMTMANPTAIWRNPTRILISGFKRENPNIPFTWLCNTASKRPTTSNPDTLSASICRRAKDHKGKNLQFEHSTNWNALSEIRNERRPNSNTHPLKINVMEVREAGHDETGGWPVGCSRQSRSRKLQQPFGKRFRPERLAY